MKKNLLKLTVLAAVFMLTMILRPVTQIRLDSYAGILDDLQTDADAFVEQGEAASSAALADVITERLRTYILDKAEVYGASLQVTVKLADGAIPAPVAVTLQGSASPYARKQLTAILTDDLGIAQEGQTWILQG